MRTWVKVTLVGFAVCMLAFSLLAGAGAYLFFRHLETTTRRRTNRADRVRGRPDEVRGRPPLIDVTNPKSGDIRVNRVKHPRRPPRQHGLRPDVER